MERITKTDSSSARKYLVARALLLCDVGEGGPRWKVAQVAEALGVSTKTIESIKQRTLEGGLKAALEIRKRVTPPIEARFDGAFAARLTTLACSPAPEGFARWTVRLLAQKVVELGIAREVSTMTIQRTLKKTRCSLTSANTGNPS